MFYFALFCVEPNLMRLAVTMFILGVGTSPSGKARGGVNKSNTANTGIRTSLTPAAGSIGRRSTISYDQAKTSSSSTERTNDVPRYQRYYLFRTFYPYLEILSLRGSDCGKTKIFYLLWEWIRVDFIIVFGIW